MNTRSSPKEDFASLRDSRKPSRASASSQAIRIPLRKPNRSRKQLRNSNACPSSEPPTGILLSDGAGDEVYGQSSLLFGGSGSFADSTIAKAANVAAKPRNLDHTEAGALSLAGVSALQALTEHSN
jgi:hypothetical protein